MVDRFKVIEDHLKRASRDLTPEDPESEEGEEENTKNTTWGSSQGLRMRRDY